MCSSRANHPDSGVAECGGDDCGCPVPYFESDAYRLVVDVHLRREGKLIGAEMVLELPEERYHVLFHGSLDVNHVVQSALGAIGGDSGLVPERPYGAPCLGLRG